MISVSHINSAKNEVLAILNYEEFNFYWNLGKVLVEWEIENDQIEKKYINDWLSTLDKNLFCARRLDQAVKFYTSFPNSSEVTEIALLYNWSEIEFVFEVDDSDDCVALIYHLVHMYEDVKSKMRTSTFLSNSFILDQLNHKQKKIKYEATYFIELIHTKLIDSNFKNEKGVTRNGKSLSTTGIIFLVKNYDNVKRTISTAADKSNNKKVKIWQVVEQSINTINRRVNAAVNRNYWQIGKQLSDGNFVKHGHKDEYNKIILQNLNDNFGDFFETSFIDAIHIFGRTYNSFTDSVRMSLQFSWDFIKVVLMAKNKLREHKFSEKLTNEEIIQVFYNNGYRQIHFENDVNLRIEKRNKKNLMTNQSISLEIDEIDIDDFVTNMKPFDDRYSPLINMVLFEYGLNNSYTL